MSGIYLHIPFCKQACHYCNFHFSTSLQFKEEMVAAIAKEIELTAPFDSGRLTGKETCDTIYFGGGTPSILSNSNLHLLLETLQNKFQLSNKVEITLEANPDDINPAALNQWREAGINRLSVGIQSFSSPELVWMNRAHTAVDALRCIEEIQAAGFTDYSVDLIFGSPLLDNAGWKKNVFTVLQKEVPHLSCYALTVEPNTALNTLIAKQKKAPVDPDKQAEQFLLLVDWMEAAGYEHYEISNFAKPGMRSKHNSSYWQGKNYYGFGPSAHSYDGKQRRWNIANNALYLQSLKKEVIPFEAELLTPIQQLNEYIMTSLRTMEGIDLDKVATLFGIDNAKKLQLASAPYFRSGKLQTAAQHLLLTREGKLFADGIAADLFF